MNTVTVIPTPDINHDTIPPKMIPRQLRRQRRPRQHHSALLLLPPARGAKHAGGRRGLRDNFAAAVYLRELAQDVPGNRESEVLACVGGGWRRVQRARVGADDDDVLKAGTERFERLDGVVVEEEQGAVEG
jgi:hypothetical protein